MFLRYLQGGVASGFRHVVENNFDDWTPRLFHCKGKRNVRCTQARLPKVFFIIKQHCKVEVVTTLYENDLISPQTSYEISPLKAL